MIQNKILKTFKIGHLTFSLFDLLLFPYSMQKVLYIDLVIIFRVSKKMSIWLGLKISYHL